MINEGSASASEIVTAALKNNDRAIVLRQVYSKVEKDYKPSSDRDITDVEYVAINGMLKKLDPHSYIFTPKEFDDFTSGTHGNFGGLGIVISTNDDGEIIVVSPMDGTPAEKEGIEAGDVIVQINDESAINLPISKAVEKMRGKPGTAIDIYVRREGVPTILKFKIIRAIIKVKSVISAMPAKGIGYVKLTGFQENTYTQFVAALADLKKKGMKALILDMRNNPGGLLTQAIKISDKFLDKGVVVSTVNGLGLQRKDVSYADKEDGDVLDIPIAVMINEGSASASEIVTAALKNNDRAIVVGRKSFGKGSVQNLFRSPYGGGLKLTIAQYLTPGNVSIQSVGIAPDVEYMPSYVDEKRVSIFKSRSNIMKEKDLEEHIESEYAPKVIDKPSYTIRYFKEYKDPEILLKERRKEKVGVFKSDEEVELTIKLLNKKFETGRKMIDLAAEVKSEEWSNIVTKLKKIGVDWKQMTSMKDIDPDKLKVQIVSESKLSGGKVNILKFKASYPGKVENLVGLINTNIPYLQNAEIIFGSFKGSIETDLSKTS